MCNSTKQNFKNINCFQTNAIVWVDTYLSKAPQTLCVYSFEGESTAISVSACIIWSWNKTKYFSIQTTHLSFKNSSSCYVLSPFSVSWEFSDTVRFNEENRPSSKVTERSQRLSWALNSHSSRQIFIIAWQSRPKWINGCSCVQKRLNATECSDVLKK